MAKMNLEEGVCHLLMTQAVAEAVRQQALKDKIEVRGASTEEVVDAIVLQAEQALRRLLSEKLAKLNVSMSRAEVVACLEEVLRGDGARELLEAVSPVMYGERTEASLLLEVKTLPSGAPKQRPVSDIHEATLLIPDGRTPQLGTQLLSELDSCERADWLVSFIKFSAIKRFYPVLERFCSQPTRDGGPRLRIATTTYMGASDYRALELLLKLPNTEIRVAYETHDRHHAKAYLFHRPMGFSTAYIGSANLSSPAMTEGLEWTIKVPEVAMPELWKRARVAFEECWQDEKRFQLLIKDELPRLKEALKQAASVGTTRDNGDFTFFELKPHHYQKVALDAIERERAGGRWRHLIVAATGTGKTMIAAFYYQWLCRTLGYRPNLLFIAHRKDILVQALKIFRHVLRKADFGDIVTGEGLPQTAHLFSTVSSWTNKLKEHLDTAHFQLIIVDECHHSAAASYDAMLNHYAPAIEVHQTELLGLTATPEREDGKDIRAFFDGGTTHELSLALAINNGFLVPFDYFALADDTVDLSKVRWGTQAADDDVRARVEDNIARARLVYNAVGDYVNAPNQMRALGFCAGIKHAQLMARVFNAMNLPAEVLTGADTLERRKAVVARLTDPDVSNRLNIIFTADLFNEGVDIPSVDTVLMLRPTDNATVFTQQLGRGLRLSPDTQKESLLVLDFVAKANERFNGAKKFNILTTHKSSVVGIRQQVAHGMPFLPRGCSVTLEQQASDTILTNLKQYVDALRGKKFVDAVITHIKAYGQKRSLQQLMEDFSLARPHALYAASLLPNGLADEIFHGAPVSPELNARYGKFLLRVLENDDPQFLATWLQLLECDAYHPSVNQNEQLARFNLISSLDTQHVRTNNVDIYWQELYTRSSLKEDLKELLRWMQRTILPRPQHPEATYHGLTLHARYTRNQISAALGHNGHIPQSGIVQEQHAGKKHPAFFVTRHKNRALFSAKTMYEDYALTEKTFQWETQHHTSVTSSNVKAYIAGKQIPLLFLQEAKQTDEKVPQSFVFLGPMHYRSHEGSQPVRFIWELQYEMPPDIYDWARS